MANLQNKTYKCLRALNLTLMHGISVCVCMCAAHTNYPGPLLHVELEFTCLSGLVINISLCIGYTICLYIAYIRPQPLGCLGSSVVRAPV